ncbi:MAG: metallophosphoesterase [Limisphaerales bacterium]
MSMGACHVISDLHLFSRRSLATNRREELEQVVRESRSLVLAGDIVDFKWSEIGDEERTAEAATEWIEELMRINPRCELHYVLGNHDDHPALIAKLTALAECHERFNWDRFHVRLGNAVFLQGDAAQARMSPERLGAFREKFAGHKRRGRALSRLYDLAVAARIHVVSAIAVYPQHRVLRRLYRYLDQIEAGPVHGVRNVYFGHTHRAINDVEYGGLRFHNCGAPIAGLKFKILKAELE